MPELPEVETVVRGLKPVCEGHVIARMIVRDARLRWPITDGISDSVKDQKILSVTRRGKYILFELSVGTLMIHLGMTGVLRICDLDQSVKKHDHVDIVLSNNKMLRYNDTRRFGAVLYTVEPIEQHPLIQHLGPEPFDEVVFHGDYIFQNTRGKMTPIKSWLMNAQNVVGVGNIYACEVLFYCNIHPLTLAKNLTLVECDLLVCEVRKVLHRAIKAGGTTLKDFQNIEGKPGYFVQALSVYGREHAPCVWCGYTLENIKISGRQTVFCPNCQLYR